VVSEWSEESGQKKPYRYEEVVTVDGAGLWCHLEPDEPVFSST
jgi:hypothetical protein